MFNSGIPLSRSLLRKLETFQSYYEVLLRAYTQARAQIDELRGVCLQKEEDLRRAVATHNSMMRLVHQRSEENALLRLKNLEQWEQICRLSERLDVNVPEYSMTGVETDWV